MHTFDWAGFQVFVWNWEGLSEAEDEIRKR
jgi:hypothetical protein